MQHIFLQKNIKFYEKTRKTDIVYHFMSQLAHVFSAIESCSSMLRYNQNKAFNYYKLSIEQ